MIYSFYSVTTNTIDKHAPLKKLSKEGAKFQSKPWISQGIQKSIKTKKKLLILIVIYEINISLITLNIKFTGTN